MSSGFDLDEFLKMQHLKTQMDYNVIVQVGKEHDFEEFHMNSVFLISTSEYFNKIFSSGNMVKKNGKYTIKIENINPYTFNSMFMYIYTGQVNLNNKTGTELLDIVIASDELKLKPLTKTTEDFMIENHQGFLRMDPVKPYEKVLPKELVDDILKFHTVSGYTPTLKVLPRRPNSQN
ncbi:hypothetical protein GLOIN_2v1483644 [Rhizophagus irregularis DAOM 181602=DAOM 197198]|uniref:BTB domain-containing protein n=1 Tax=Rhizophagus irregularis (strain DAOM 181602 / DAOM 197198 / MUCL 43194) TaxID=747089 RepID=A0A2P4PH65_RHIID|nr:hypothetical protein GLOIN_2v1483644 [Rhizophagus irregularis DAOM 181602=DAOM 197198]POG64732.1 hypothetical protein GLOIN_2v1483644 [Rhizophagus irregularis DAOM 181602=DAOM 197198]|eukprot:XP_025171598.1 hypothetical protein GLOIN_2v1483644 [Rhizophagus irregularis DAOM 181602=DAOM 197198]